MVIPDVLVVCDRGWLGDPAHIAGAPGLVVEVLSPSNRDHDITFKFMIYRKYGVKEYWIVDPKKEQVLVHDLENMDLPANYTFDQVVPVGISENACSIDFRSLKDDLSHFRR